MKKLLIKEVLEADEVILMTYNGPLDTGFVRNASIAVSINFR